MKPAILILVHAILIASQVPHVVNSADDINLIKARNLDTTLKNDIKKYNDAASKTQSDLVNIIATAKRLRNLLNEKLSVLKKHASENPKTTQEFLTNRLKEVYEKLFLHYVSVLWILRTSSDCNNNLAIKSTSKFYKESDYIVQHLLYLENAENFPRLAIMYQKNKRLADMLNNFNDINLSNPNERLKFQPEILSMASMLLRESEAGGYILRNEFIDTTDTARAKELSELVDLFDRLKNHYHELRDATATIKDGNIWASISVNQLETQKTIESIYKALALGTMKNAIKF